MTLSSRRSNEGASHSASLVSSDGASVVLLSPFLRSAPLVPAGFVVVRSEDGAEVHRADTYAGACAMAEAKRFETFRAHHVVAL